ncbi:hypothetical protein [Streptomyces sp. NPDC047014]|uniref:hypothetical protein n=1 Tax=Streptomyces sp. NPDC047014 TaxID=3155736 RepID=UPI0033D46F63
MDTQAVHATQRPSSPKPHMPGWVARRVLPAVAVAATLPYLSLKSAWLAGSTIGIPAGSALREPGGFLLAVNAVTLAMDACVILLVLVLTRPWGRRVPGWLLIVPAFVATGLLTPILCGFAGQLTLRALGFGAGPEPTAGPEPYLDPWVFPLVYGGFTLQGLALAGLLVPYARTRWGRRLRGVTGERLPSPTGVVAAAAAVCGLVIAVAHAYWAFGGAAGLPPGRAAAHTAEGGVVAAVHGLGALAAGAGALLLARGGRPRARLPLGLAWTGAAVTLSWGAGMLLASLGPSIDGGEGPSLIGRLTYAGQMLTGSLTAAVLVRFLMSRPAR